MKNRWGECMEYEIEKALYAKGINFLAGVDEAGRGPLAGPVFAAAVVLKNGQFLDGVTDSFEYFYFRVCVISIAHITK